MPVTPRNPSHTTALTGALLMVAGLAAVGYWGHSLPRSGATRWFLAVVCPVAVAVLWALVVAPKSQVGFSPDVKRWLGTALLLGCAAALADV